VCQREPRTHTAACSLPLDLARSLLLLESSRLDPLPLVLGHVGLISWPDDDTTASLTILDVFPRVLLHSNTGGDPIDRGVL
jgi:hypothetical protein